MARKRSAARSKKSKTLLGSVVTGCLAILLYILSQAAENIPALRALFRDFGTGSSYAFEQMPQGFLWDGAAVKVHFIDVGQGDAILVQTPSRWVLVDGGDNGHEQELFAYLDSLKVQKLDAVIATHMHADHIGGLPETLSTYKVDSLLIPPTQDDLTPTSRTYERLLDAASSHSIPVHEVPPDAIFDLGDGAKLTFLSPLGSHYENLNETSLVCRLTYGDTAFMLTGDAEKVNEAEMLAKYPSSQLRSDVLKLGHHGSTTSNTKPFLQAVSPAVTVATVGKDNEYGHPHKEIVERVAALNAPMYRSDKNGNIVIASDGRQIALKTEL